MSGVVTNHHNANSGAKSATNHHSASPAPGLESPSSASGCRHANEFEMKCLVRIESFRIPPPRESQSFLQSRFFSEVGKQEKEGQPQVKERDNYRGRLVRVDLGRKRPRACGQTRVKYVGEIKVPARQGGARSKAADRR